MNSTYKSKLDEFEADAARALIEEFGYVVISSFWDRHSIADLKDAFALVAKSCLYQLGQQDLRSSEVSLNLRRLRAQSWEIEGLYRLILNPSAMARYRHLLLCDRVFVHPNIVPRYTPPDLVERDINDRAHQDFPEVQGSLRTLTFWFPFVDLPSKGGALCIAPMSHRNGVAPIRVANTASGLAVKQRYNEWHTDDLQAGDCIIFCSTTVHSVQANMLGVPKLTMDFRVQPFDEPVSINTLSMPDRQSSFAEIQQTWTDETKLHWRQTPETVAYDRAFENERDLQALVLAESIDAKSCDFPSVLRGLSYAKRTNPDPSIRSKAACLLHRLGHPNGIDLGF